MDGSRTSISKQAKPAWGWLYAVLPLAFALSALSEAMAVSGPARIVIEVLATFLVFGALALWVRVNRLALELIGDRGPGRRFREPACPAPGLDHGDASVPRPAMTLATDRHAVRPQHAAGGRHR